MNISRIHASAQLTTSIIPSRPESSNTINLGTASSSNNFDKDLYASYVRNIKIYSMGESGYINIANGSCTDTLSYNAPTAQSTKATAIGTVTTNGTILISVTSEALTAYAANTKIITITTTGLPNAATWAAQARTALLNDSVISSFFSVSGTGADILLTRIIDDAGLPNDATLNIEIEAGTAVGITNAPSSTSLATGSEATGVLFDEYNSVDVEGITLPAMALYTSVLHIKCLRGSASITDDSASFLTQIAKDNFFIHSNNNPDFDTGLYDSIYINSIATPFEANVLIVTKKA